MECQNKISLPASRGNSSFFITDSVVSSAQHTMELAGAPNKADTFAPELEKMWTKCVRASVFTTFTVHTTQTTNDGQLGHLNIYLFFALQCIHQLYRCYAIEMRTK